MKTRTSARCRRQATVALLFLLLLATVLPAIAAYRVQRPITYDGGRLNQSYLYGEVWGTSTHKGVDFSYGLGTDVYAIADGTVVDLEENIANGTGNSFGNFVLIRHDERHWDRIEEQWGYVYSIYAHLSEDSVRYSEGDSVTAGTWIAEVDDTGWSSGHHLHLQICIHPQSDRTLVPNTLNSENTSRNPELWLQAFNYGGTNTGTVVGKVTDGNGQPIGDRYIWGLNKPQGSSGTTYQWSRTYAYAWANPDDILVENWGTTDVLPGLYHLFVKNESGSYTYEDLGWHTVEAGKTTYVGLYPVYLPDVMENYYGWNSSIVVRNNSDSKTAQVNTTFFWDDGDVRTQNTDYIAPHSTVTVDFPGTCYYCRGSAIVSGGEDVSVVVETKSSSQAYAYNGITPASGDPAFRTGRTIYTPLSIARYGNWHTTLVVQNAGSSPADVAITYRNPSGSSRGTFHSYDIPPNGSRTLDANAHLGSSFTGSAVVTSDQEIAVIVRESDGSMVGTYNGASAGATTTYVPLVLKGYSDWTTGFQIQNVDSQGATASITYYNSNGGVAGTQPISIPGNGNLWVVPSVTGPWSGVAVVTSDRGLAVEVDEYNAGSGDLESYNGLSLATSTAYLPDVRDSATWYTGLVLQNTSGSWSNVRLRVNGVTSWQGWIQGHGWRSVRPNGTGSAVVESLSGRGLVVQVDNYWATGGDMLMSYMGDNR